MRTILDFLAVTSLCWFPLAVGLMAGFLAFRFFWIFGMIEEE